MNEDFLKSKLADRTASNSLRSLRRPELPVDFCSNDYLGIVKNQLIEKRAPGLLSHGSTGSRLLSGNYLLIENTETAIADFHQSPAGLIFNSGYDANTGLLSAVPQRGDGIIYDQLSHASIRDGIRLSFATSYCFLHNDLADLEKKLAASAGVHPNTFVVTESVFSMDGDLAPLKGIATLCDQYNASLIIDEAHATGIIGNKGEGLVQHLGLQEKCFARVHTFGKACGCHGAIVLGSKLLKQYLINFSRQFIYSTSLPPASVVAMEASYQIFPLLQEERKHLLHLIASFRRGTIRYSVGQSNTPIQIVIIPGNDEVKKVAESLHAHGLDVRAILYPTVPKGKERLRIVFHAFNSEVEVEKLISVLSR